MKTFINNLVVAKMREVKKDLDKAIGVLEEIRSIAKNFKMKDLKVHDISYYIWKKQEEGLLTREQAQNLFEHIIHVEYQNFQEWEQENLSHINRSYIGRTSSFHYSTLWYGEVIDNCTANEILEGKTYKDDYYFIGSLNNNTYRYLIDKDENALENIVSWMLMDKEEIKHLSNNEKEEIFSDQVESYFEDDLSNIELISCDLEQLLEIVKQTKKAYDHLNSYQTKENEYEVAKMFLESEIENYISEEVAEKILDDLYGKLLPLNTVEFNFIDATINNDKCTFTIGTNHYTGVLYESDNDNDVKKLLAQCVFYHLKKLINHNFDTKLEDK